MKLHEIISINEEHDKSILIETLLKYRRSLYTYYSDYFRSEPVLMVTSVSNAVQYAKIVPANEFTESVEEWIDSAQLDEETTEHERETISFNSRMLVDFI